mgnify:CR=1 FL=1
MRHAKKNNPLSRKAPHRKALLSNMACSLIKHKRIKTTLAKAKALRVYLEPLITKSKNDTTHSRRVVFSYLKQKEIVTELFGDIANKITDRPGTLLYFDLSSETSFLSSCLNNAASFFPSIKIIIYLKYHWCNVKLHTHFYKPNQ